VDKHGSVLRPQPRRRADPGWDPPVSRETSGPAGLGLRVSAPGTGPFRRLWRRSPRPVSRETSL